MVVFGIPVSWYLFLQFFGENKFDLPRMGQWDTTCVTLDRASLVVRRGEFTDFPNQLKRTQEKLKGQNVIDLLLVDSCDFGSEMCLVDNREMIRGKYQINREEIDRLLTEIDIYLLNVQNESGNQHK